MRIYLSVLRSLSKLLSTENPLFPDGSISSAQPSSPTLQATKMRREHSKAKLLQWIRLDVITIAALPLSATRVAD